MESTLFRNVQHDSHVWMLQRVSVLIRAPAGSRVEVCGGLQPPAAALGKSSRPRATGCCSRGQKRSNEASRVLVLLSPRNKRDDC